VKALNRDAIRIMNMDTRMVENGGAGFRSALSKTLLTMFRMRRIKIRYRGLRMVESKTSVENTQVNQAQALLPEVFLKSWVVTFIGAVDPCLSLK
jgi:hypothetical protein